jgi:CRISPR/Cas system type I-B associated protein Csh2 (Cas7 group RAMP superfamily)
MTTETTQPHVHSYRIRYFIVDDFGELRWEGTTTITQNRPRPEREVDQAVLDVQTARTIRRSCDDLGAPDGRVLIAAVHAV